MAVAVAAMTVVIVQRIALSLREAGQRRLERRYQPLIDRALRGDSAAIAALARCRPRECLPLARRLLLPLIEDRDPQRIAATRAIMQAMPMIPIADRYLRSRWWWRRAIALQALGVMQYQARSGEIVAALDDGRAEVRNAALDALADMKDPATLPAIVVRLLDSSLQVGRRIAALAAFGSTCEEFLLDLAAVDRDHHVNYARALAICGTERSRPELCRWTADPRTEVRAAALEALARIGLDERAASLTIAALDSPEVPVRATAAAALRGWTGPGDGAARLARHLDDTWTVAVPVARTLQSMGEAGLVELRARANGSDVAGVLARQMLWEAGTRA
jgi:HEAT repeat protein